MDQDSWRGLGASCAQHFRGGWWFNACFSACVTCPEINYFLNPNYENCGNGHSPTHLANNGEYNWVNWYKEVGWAKAEFLLIPSKSPLTFNYRI